MLIKNKYQNLLCCFIEFGTKLSLFLTNLLKLYFMLKWAAIFLVISIVAAIFGFGGIAEGAASIAKVLFFIFIVLFVLTLIFGAKIFGK